MLTNNNNNNNNNNDIDIGIDDIYSDNNAKNNDKDEDSRKTNNEKNDRPLRVTTKDRFSLKSLASSLSKPTPALSPTSPLLLQSGTILHKLDFLLTQNRIADIKTVYNTRGHEHADTHMHARTRTRMSSSHPSVCPYVRS